MKKNHEWFYILMTVLKNVSMKKKQNRKPISVLPETRFYHVLLLIENTVPKRLIS